MLSHGGIVIALSVNRGLVTISTLPQSMLNDRKFQSDFKKILLTESESVVKMGYIHGNNKKKKLQS